MAKALLEKALAEKKPSAKAKVKAVKQAKVSGKFATYAIAAIIIILVLVFLAVLQQQAKDYLNSPTGKALGEYPDCLSGYYLDTTNCACYYVSIPTITYPPECNNKGESLNTEACLCESESTSTPQPSPSGTLGGICGWVSEKAFTFNPWTSPEPVDCGNEQTWSNMRSPVSPKATTSCTTDSDCDSLGGSPGLGSSSSGIWCCLARSEVATPAW